MATTNLGLEATWRTRVTNNYITQIILVKATKLSPACVVHSVACPSLLKKTGLKTGVASLREEGPIRTPRAISIRQLIEDCGLYPNRHYHVYIYTAPSART